ncbi:pyrroline-5-carboxylate reductase [Arenibacter latericius]|uniref:pyrroline-5-carboxylate reductase n=1 Tax=Arenibacter latericius TaxID=86104 RepID=UPI00040028AB|nr:pyrroline-5-carboxylate reductase [Arenibacter latericius]MDX1364539.1 pyrroline-5-carboxylate reductase [Arenibacter latericius]
MRVLVIGAGNMGLTYAESMSKSNLLKKKLMIFDNSPEKTTSLKKVSHFEVYDKLEEALPKADLIFVAVKPYHCEDLFKNIKEFLSEDQIIISIMAGVTIGTMQEALGIHKVVRAMPNLPAQIGKGVTSFTASKEVSRIELLTIESLLDTTGRSIYVSTEKFIDASTGISGSGPAYVFYFMQSMMEAALKMGFSTNDSKVLVSKTFEGAVDLFNQSDLSPNSWMDRVASKGGTTRAALDSMEDNNVKELIKEAAYSAFNRAVELGKEK